jgi:ParB-like chromosome segregation protein Spo0J
MFWREEAMTLAIDLTEQQERALREAAHRLNISPDQLAAAAVRDLVAQTGADFDAAAARVMEKNRELYKRLA